jgi:hypothetical protein
MPGGGGREGGGQDVRVESRGAQAGSAGRNARWRRRRLELAEVIAASRNALLLPPTWARGLAAGRGGTAISSC